MFTTSQKNLLNSTPRIAKIAIPVPLSGLFDYLIPPNLTLADNLAPGCRIRVPFGHRSVIGIFCSESKISKYDSKKIKSIEKILDSQPLLSPDLIELANKASRYYHHPIGEVYTTLLPNALAQGRDLTDAEQSIWQISEQGKSTDTDSLKRAHKQQLLLKYLQNYKQPCDADRLNKTFNIWRPALKALINKGLVNVLNLPPAIKLQCHPGLDLNKEQALAITSIEKANGFAAFLLNGITGSGKTEVYLQVVEQYLKRGQQVLILVPEIGLTPQLIQRFQTRFNIMIVGLHSSLTDLERLRAWHLAYEGLARIIIGTRSALFTNMPKLGLIIIDEEHDSSFKQQDNFRYHARDLAVMRAKLMNITILMGTATPSLESLFNIKQNRYTQLKLTQRAGNAKPPRITVIDNRRNFNKVLSPQIHVAITEHLAKGNQVLLFLNRRGYAPVLNCPSCGWHAQCQHCDTSMTLHNQPRRLCCHHCAAVKHPEKHCPNCKYTKLDTIGLGTEQLEQELQNIYPNYKTIRIDSDSTKRKGSLEAQLNKIQRGEGHILLGTQILAKGHHFPKVTLVAVLDCDRGFFSADFRGTEKMAQLILQVAGRAGREELIGHVMVQSNQPENPLLHTLITQGYEAFSQTCLSERKKAWLPPYNHFALLRVEAMKKEMAMNFLSAHIKQLCNIQGVDLLGPTPAPMERRAGKFRAQLLLQSQNRRALHQQLDQLRYVCENSKINRNVCWSLDIDPINMF